MTTETEPVMTIDWTKAEAILRRLARVSEEFECEAQALLPFGQRRIAIRVEVLPPLEVTETNVDP
jgi:hypothetical protein